MLNEELLCPHGRFAAPRLLGLLVAAALTAPLLIRFKRLLPRRPSPLPSVGVGELTLEGERQREIELDGAVAKIRERFARKQREMQALLEGRSSLEQVILTFRKLNSSYSATAPQIGEEAIYGDVLIHAAYFLRDHPEAEISAALAPIHRSLEEHLRQRRGAGR